MSNYLEREENSFQNIGAAAAPRQIPPWLNLNLAAHFLTKLDVARAQAD